jgi:uncharacterized protein
MEIKLKKKPQKPIIIEGFPGFGLIGTITTEFLIEHLKAEQIGSFEFDEMPPTIAIHKEKVVNPMGIFYDKKNNIIILHTMLNLKGNEWKMAKEIENMVKKLKAKEVISIEGVSSALASKESNVYCYSEDNKKLCKIGLEPIKESIIVGVTAGLMLRPNIKVTGLFAETHSQLPDSKAAAKVIEALDKYLNLKVDYKPLLKQAEEFEGKLKKILEQTAATSKEQDKKRLNYVG